MSESTTTSGTPASELRAFKEAAVAALGTLGRAGELAGSEMSRFAKRAGLPGDYKPDGTGYKLPEIPEETTGPKGLPREKFSAAALDEHDTAQLAAARQAVYDTIRNAVLGREVSRAAAVEALTALGLVTPLTRTAVSANVAGVGAVSFTLPGTPDREEIRAKLAEQAKDPQRDAVLAAFPDAVPGGELVTSLLVYEEEGWPRKFDGS